MYNFYDYSLPKLEELIVSFNEKKYRATQLFKWVYKRKVFDFDAMSDVSKTFREFLKENFVFIKPKIYKKQVSKDGTIKLLLELEDGAKVETVLMRYNYGNVACVSSEVGCNMGCAFCASGILKKQRELKASEILGQVLVLNDLLFEEGNDERITHVVVMGTGEPFDNYDNVMDFIRILNNPHGLEIGARHITVSTCGIVPKIYDYANEGLQINLAISLHAPNDEIRNKIMAISRVYPLDELMKAVKYYEKTAGRRVTLDVAQDFVKSIAYTDMGIGNEGVAEQAKIAGYSQTDFEAIQSLFNEGEMRDFSSIPRIQGRANGYTYEMLRLDDPLALTIGTLTDCCQRIHKEGETSMEHSVVSPDGRVFVVKNEEGKIVAQSWFWRNQHVGCFDNIEIPERIIAEYEKKHSDFGRKGLTADVLEVYKKATQELMKEDERVYQQLLENGTITQEQYDSLLLGRVTIGAGYNDIKNALREAHSKGEFRLDATNEILPKKTERLRYIYDDAHYEDDGEHDGQYIISEREGIVKSEQENLYVHQDDVPVYDGTSMSSTVLLTMKRMEQATKRDNLAYLSERSDEANLPKSKRIINSIAREYGFDPDSTKVMATARIALIYSKDKDKIRIGDLLSSPLKEDLNEEQKQKATAHIMYQVKKALKQIGVQNSKVDISSLSKEQQQMLQSVMQEIEKENDERGGR